MIVLLHGLGSSPDDVAPLARKLWPERRCFLPKLAGHAGRPLPEKTGIVPSAADILEQMDKERIERAVVAGYSLGAYISLYLARHHPDRVSAAVPIAPKFRYEENAMRHIRHLIDPSRVDQFAKPGDEKLGEVFTPDELAERLRRVTQIYERLHSDPPLREEDFRAIGQPVLILTGSNDPLANRDEAYALADLLPNARVGLWAGSAHPFGRVPLIEAKHAIAEFVGQVEAGTFRPGKTRSLDSTFVNGGLAHPDTAMVVQKSKARAERHAPPGTRFPTAMMLTRDASAL